MFITTDENQTKPSMKKAGMYQINNVVYFVNILEDMADIMSMDNHLRGVLGLRGFFYLVFLFIVEIWHDVQKG